MIHGLGSTSSAQRRCVIIISNRSRCDDWIDLRLIPVERFYSSNSTRFVVDVFIEKNKRAKRCGRRETDYVNLRLHNDYRFSAQHLKWRDGFSKGPSTTTATKITEAQKVLSHIRKKKRTTNNRRAGRWATRRRWVAKFFRFLLSNRISIVTPSR